MTAPVTLKGYWTIAEAVEHAAPKDAQQMRDALECGELQAAAVLSENGMLAMVTAAAWRCRFGLYGDPREEIGWNHIINQPVYGGYVPARIAFDEARAGRTIPIATTKAGTLIDWAHPLIAQADLARWIGAEPQPEPPERPAGWKLVAPAMVSDPAAMRAQWMLGYLAGYKEANKNRVATRDVAIAGCSQKMPCTTREAEAAYEAAPYPDLRNPPPAKRGQQADQQ